MIRLQHYTTWKIKIRSKRISQRWPQLIKSASIVGTRSVLFKVFWGTKTVSQIPPTASQNITNFCNYSRELEVVRLFVFCNCGYFYILRWNICGLLKFPCGHQSETLKKTWVHVSQKEGLPRPECSLPQVWFERAFRSRVSIEKGQVC